MLRKIVTVGPESTGKSTLCSQLAAHFGTLWCPEYAREYLLEHGTDYTFENLLTVAKGQLRLEEEYGRRVMDESGSSGHGSSPGEPSVHLPANNNCHNKLLFIDTDMYVMRVWCEFVFGKCHNWILRRIAERPYDLYLLCNTDLPWAKDELREYPDHETRLNLYYYYKDTVINSGVAWAEVSGTNEQRLQTAVEAVNKYIFKF